MRKRLDLQSLLEKCDQDELIGFLRNRFTKDPNLATQFLVHFASSFDLEEEEFCYITRRIDRLLSYKPEGMTKRRANMIRGLIKDLIEQSRDTISKGNFRQAFIILAGLNQLLDPYLDRIPQDYGFHVFQKNIYHFLEIVFNETPAPELQSRVVEHFHEMISEGKSIPFYEDANPYWLWFQADPTAEEEILQILAQKIETDLEWTSLFLRQWVRIVALEADDSKLQKLIQKHWNDLDLYHYLSEYLPDTKLDPELVSILLDLYDKTDRRSIKNKIYQIIQDRDSPDQIVKKLSLSEFLETGEESVLDVLQEHMMPDEIVNWLLEKKVPVEDKDRRMHLYRGLEYLNAFEALKSEIMKDPDVFVLLHFVDALYDHDPVKTRDRLWFLIEQYLNDHFGLPAFNRIHEIIEVLSPIRYERLQNFLIQKIRNTFGHRKHFQQLMKELAK